MKKYLTKKIVTVTSALAIAISGVNVPNMSNYSYAAEAQKLNVLRKSPGWTFGIYMCGNNLEQEGGSASSDLLEILKANVPKEFSENNNIIVGTGGAIAWHFKDIYSNYLMEEKGLSEKEVDQIIPDEIDSSKLSLYRVNYNHKYKADDGSIKTIPAIEHIKDIADYDPALVKEIQDFYGSDEFDEAEVEKNKFSKGKRDSKNSKDESDVPKEYDDEKYANMGAVKYIREFLNELDTNYAAEHMAIDLWNHGGGITGGVCYDQYTENPITLGELKQVLKERAEDGYEKYDLIGYDACFMSNYESWVNLAPYAKVGVGALTSEFGDGWYYTPFIEKLANNYSNESYDGKRLGADIVKAHKDYYGYDGILMKDMWENAYEGEGEYSEEFLDDANYYLEDETLCAVDLEKIAQTAIKFSEFGDDLFKASVDEDSMKDILLQCSNVKPLDRDCSFVGISNLFDLLEENAPERIKELTDSPHTQYRIAAQGYEECLEDIKELRESITSSIISAYNGWETSRYNDSIAMSVFLPAEYAGDETAYFNVNDYMNYTIGDSYAKVMYMFSHNLTLDRDMFDFKDLPYDVHYNYDKNSGKYSFEMDQESAGYVNNFSGYTYANVDGKKYLINCTNTEPWASEKNTFTMKPLCEYLTFGKGKPVYFDEKNYLVEDDAILSYRFCHGFLNGVYGEFTFVKDMDSDRYVFDGFYADKDNENIVDEDELVVDELKVGDKIKLEVLEADKAMYCVTAEDYSNNTKKSYTDEYVIKASDMVEYTEHVGGKYDTDIEHLSKKKVLSPKFDVLKVEENAVDLVLGYDLVIENPDGGYECFITDSKAYNVGKVNSFSNGEIKIEKKEFELTGEGITPKVEFVNSNLKEGVDYKVEYENNIGIGKARVVIKGMGTLEGLEDRIVEFDIVKIKNADGKIVYKTVIINTPDKTKVKLLKNNKKKSLKVSWKKIKGVSGYEVFIARDKKFTKGKKVKDVKKTSTIIKNLKKNKKYYVKVRAYKVDPNGKKVYGKYSDAKKKIIKK